jgi:hypothetical protein
MEGVICTLILVFSIAPEPFGFTDMGGGWGCGGGRGCELAAGVDIYYSKGSLL